jgi:hypothetical protein
LLRFFKRGGSRCKIGSADLHGFAACGINLLPSHRTASNVHNEPPFRVQNCLKRNIQYMRIGIKKRIFLSRFQKSITFPFDKMSPTKVNIKELQPLCFTQFSSSVTPFHEVVIVHHAISCRIRCPSRYFPHDKFASSLRLSGTL